MSPPEIEPFSDAHLDDAARLLAARHERHRAAEPRLPSDLDLRALVDELWTKEGRSGAVGVRDARVTSYLIGTPKDEAEWGLNVWIELAGHAAEEPEDVRDLYAHAAAGWIGDGRRSHYVFVPASEHELVDAWFRLGFGAQQAHGIIDVPDSEWPDAVREAEEADVDALVALAPALNVHQQQSPVFSSPRRWTDDDVRASIVEDLERDDIATLVVERDGRIVGNFVVCPVELSSMHSGLARPPGASYLAFAVTDPGARGSGAGVALTEASFAWARAHGYETMVTDWRVTNLLASRFWPRRGFRPTFLRLHRFVS